MLRAEATRQTSRAALRVLRPKPGRADIHLVRSYFREIEGRVE